MLKKLTLISVLLITLLVACKSKGYQAPRPPSGDMNAAALQVSAKSEAFVEETQLLSLSPNGKWLFALRLESICILDVATLAEKVCAGWISTLDPDSLAWAPDSQRVAFSENLPELMESDLWVFNVSSGALSNLTNDGLDGNIETALERAQSDKVDINLDSQPAWSPDNKTLAFVRSIYGNTKQTYICTIPATGGQVTKLIMADDEHSLAVWRGMRWTPDGKKILFTITILEDTLGKNGVWIVDKNGKNYTQLLEEKAGRGYVSLYDVSAKGDKALIGYHRAIARADENPNLSFFELLDIKTGKLTPLMELAADADPSDDQVVFYSPTQATFSPDGSKILFHYNLPGEDQPTPQLVVRDVDGTHLEVLGSWPIYLGEDVGHSLFWGENDTLFLMTGPGLGILYQLGSK